MTDKSEKKTNIREFQRYSVTLKVFVIFSQVYVLHSMQENIFKFSF